MSGSGVSVVQFAILRALVRNGDMPLSRLAEDQAMERTSLYRTIAPLAELGAVRIRESNQGRSKTAHLTRKGRRLVDRASPYWEQAQSSVESKLGAEEWRALAASIADIPALLTAE